MSRRKNKKLNKRPEPKVKESNSISKKFELPKPSVAPEPDLSIFDKIKSIEELIDDSKLEKIEEIILKEVEKYIPRDDKNGCHGVISVDGLYLNYASLKKAYIAAYSGSPLAFALSASIGYGKARQWISLYNSNAEGSDITEEDFNNIKKVIESLLQVYIERINFSKENRYIHLSKIQYRGDQGLFKIDDTRSENLVSVSEDLIENLKDEGLFESMDNSNNVKIKIVYSEVENNKKQEYDLEDED